MSSGLGHPRTARIPRAPALHGGHLPVQPGAEFLYDFEPPDAGTWWYHSHHRTWEQMARGLCGALIVTLLVDREESDCDCGFAGNRGRFEHE